MANSPELARVTDQLEDAGYLGASALALIGLHLLDPKSTGSSASSSFGYVWTKSIGNGGAENRVPIGETGYLVARPATSTLTVSLRLSPEGIPRSFNVLWQLFSAGGDAGLLRFEFDKKKAVEGTPLRRDGEIVGFQKIMPERPVSIDLPAVGVEFSFELYEDRGLVSSVKLVQQGADLLNAAEGTLSLGFDGIMILPGFYGIGISLDQITFDFSENAVPEAARRFPQAYHPDWKGIIMENFRIFYPVNPEEPDLNLQQFVIGNVEYLLWGFWDDFSTRFEIDYISNNPDHSVRRVNFSLELQGSEVLQAEGTVGFDWGKTLEAFGKKAKEGNANSNDQQARDLHNKQQVNLSRLETPQIDGVIVFRLGMRNRTIGEDSVWSWHLTYEGLDMTPRADLEARQGGIVFKGGNRLLMSYILLTLGILLVDREEEEGFLPTAVSLLTIFFLNLITPRSEIVLNRIGLTLHDGPAEGQRSLELHLGARFNFPTDVSLESVAQLMEDYLGGLNKSADLFSVDIGSVRMQGVLGVEMQGISVFLSPLNTRPQENLKPFLEPQPFQIVLRDLPRISFQPNDGETYNPFITEVSLISKVVAGERHFGIAFELMGLDVEGLRVQTPSVGFAFYFYPEFCFELILELLIEPQIIVLVPGILLATGVLRLDEPLPSGSGSLTEASVDLGILYKDWRPSLDLLAALELPKYYMRQGGTYAQGNMTEMAHGREQKFSFNFIRLYFYTPYSFFPMGSVSWNGASIFYGRNIRPPVGGGTGAANALLTQLLSPQGETLLEQLGRWAPAAPGTGWHPGTVYPEGKQKDFYSFGGAWLFKSFPDQGVIYQLEIAGLIGFPEITFALAGKIKNRPTRFSVGVGVAYSAVDDSWAAAIIIDFRFDVGGTRLGQFTIPVQIGGRGEDENAGIPARKFLFIGHYDQSQGLPGIGKFLIWECKFFMVIDSARQENFGFAPVSDYQRPTLGPGGFGAGLVFSIDTGRIGPRFLNLRFYFAAGGSFGMNPDGSEDPEGEQHLCFYLDVFLAGGMSLSVFGFKFSADLALRATGLTVDGDFMLKAAVLIRVGLPFPLSDIRRTYEWILGQDQPPPLPPPVWNISITGLYREEGKTLNNLQERVQLLPIDGGVAIDFRKPIQEILVSSQLEADLTRLLVADDTDSRQLLVEETLTEFENTTFKIVFIHQIEKVRISRITETGQRQIVPSLMAGWAVPFPVPDEDSGDEGHKILYLNSQFPPELQFSAELLHEYATLLQEREWIPPCAESVQLCFTELTPFPDILPNASERPALTVDTTIGPIELEAISESPSFPYTPTNEKRLDFAGPPNQLSLTLPWVWRLHTPGAQFVEANFTLDLNSDLRDDSGVPLIERFGKKLTSYLNRLEFSGTVWANDSDFSRFFKIFFRPVIQSEADCLWEMEFQGFGENGDVIQIQVEVNECDVNNRIRFKFSANSLVQGFPIDRIQLIGFSAFFKASYMDSNHEMELLTPGTEPYLVSKLLRDGRFMLDELCLETIGGNPEVWEDENDRLGQQPGEVDNQAQIGRLMDARLLMPGSRYEVDFLIKTRGKAIQIVGEEEKDSHEKVVYSATSPDLFPQEGERKDIAPIAFRTESTPSQDVKKYVAFAHPKTEIPRPYTRSLVPVMALKNLGIIRYIWELHGGPDSLQSKLVDLNGDELAPDLLETLEVVSGPTDLLEDELIPNCLPNATEIKKTTVEIWTRELDTDQSYSLRLQNNLEGIPEAPFLQSFTTSRFRDLDQHLDLLNTEMDNATESALLDPGTFQATVEAEIRKIQTREVLGMDATVERLYRSLLGVESGRAFPNEDFGATALVSRDANNNRLTWGFALEMVEPFLDKAEFAAGAILEADSLPGGGLWIFRNGWVVFHDRSGTRLLIFFRDSNNDFTPAEDLQPSQLQNQVLFRATAPLEDAIREHIRNISFGPDPILPESEMQAIVQQAINQLTSIPQIGQRLADQNASLTLPQL